MTEDDCSDGKVELARLDERIKGLWRERDSSEDRSRERVKLAFDETMRRLEELNGAHERSERDRSQYVTKENVDNRLGEIHKMLRTLELDAREQRGRMWLPMIAIAAVAAGIAAAAVKLLVP